MTIGNEAWAFRAGVAEGTMLRLRGAIKRISRDIDASPEKLRQYASEALADDDKKRKDFDEQWQRVLDADV